MQNLRAESYGMDFPILRPLIGLDKIEIELIGKQIGTYEISISHGKEPACTIVPERPITMARPERILEEDILYSEVVDRSYLKILLYQN